jgi:hypothetical protein
MKYISQRDLLWILPLSLSLGAALSFLQSGIWLIGWLGFSFLFLLAFLLLTFFTKWAGNGKLLAWIIAIAFILRFAGGVATYLALPVYGYVDDDQSAGFTYTDAHRRDAQAWELASSNLPILDAFNKKKYAYDQYGGLLAFSALVYRYLSPDAHRPLMLVLLSAFMAALALPFLWKAASPLWGAKVAIASGWIYALYPESVLLGGSAMREPYLWAFSAFTLWGFVSFGMQEPAPVKINATRRPIELSNSKIRSLIWFGIGIAGMLLVSPVVALATLVIFGGWIYFTSGSGRISWWLVLAVVLVFIAGVFLLSSALDRNGNFGGTPINIINSFMREAVKWDVYQLERGSGWVQKLFDEMPTWMRLPFVTVYGLFQPVLPAAFVEPTKLIWRIIAILRAVGWYAMLPVLILSFAASTGQGAETKRRLFLWLSFVVWMWIVITAVRGGGDQWDNPRYRSILFLWQAILAGNAWVWWRESKNAWFLRVVAMELVFLIFFGQWYANRYLHFGPQLPFAQMVLFIAGLWALIFFWGVWRDRKRSV